jgi:hypothetical protein
MTRPTDADFVPRWIKAIKRHARHQAVRGVYEDGKIEDMPDGDDPAEIMAGIEAIEVMPQAVVEAAIQAPHGSREVAAALRVTQRHARRLLAALRDQGDGQGDLFLV